MQIDGFFIPLKLCRSQYVHCGNGGSQTFVQKLMFMNRLYCLPTAVVMLILWNVNYMDKQKLLMYLNTFKILKQREEVMSVILAS